MPRGKRFKDMKPVWLLCRWMDENANTRPMTMLPDADRCVFCDSSLRADGMHYDFEAKRTRKTCPASR